MNSSFTKKMGAIAGFPFKIIFLVLRLYWKYVARWPWQYLVAPSLNWIAERTGLKRLPATMRVLIIFGLVMFGFIGLAFWLPYQLSKPPNIPQVEYSDFRFLVETKQIAPDVTLVQSQDFLIPNKRHLILTDLRDGEKKWMSYDTPPASQASSMEEWLYLQGYRPHPKVKFPWAYQAQMATQIIPMLLIQLGIMWIFIGGGMRSLGSSWNALREDTLQKRPPVYFKDIGGMEEAKREALETIEFLKHQEEFKKAGLKMPKGILIEGPPGVGKTYFATAVATEAGYPAFLQSGASFRKPLIGLGPDEVKRWFDRLKRNMPCVGILDEADSALSSRAQRSAVESSEMAAITNTFMTEIEDIEKRDLPILIIALTNLGIQIDEAAKRSGRFDKKITVRLPNTEERKATLKIYLGMSESAVAQPVTFEPQIQTDPSRFIDEIAKITSGFSGADIANLINQARTSAVFAKVRGEREHDFLTRRDVLTTIPKILSGSFAAATPLSKKEKERLRWHEAAHAYLSWLFKEAIRAEFVVAQPHGDYLGVTIMPTEQQNFTGANFEASVKVMFGGYIIEKIEFGAHNSGSSSDLEKINNIVRGMVYKYGMSRLGPITIARVGHSPGGAQVETTEEGEEEVRRIVIECEGEVLKLLAKDEVHYVRVKKLVDALTACPDPQMLVGSEIEQILGPIEQI